jgi:uncharacterized protein (TIRG00374 family)
MRRLAFLIISLLVSLVLLYFVLRDVPLEAISAAIRQAHPFWMLVCLASSFAGLFTRGIRWRGLLMNRLSIRESFLIISMTFLVNQLPFRLGEVARSILARRRQIPLVTAATSIVVERLLDTVLVLVLLSWAISQLPAIDSSVRFWAIAFGLAALLAFILMLLFAHFPHIAHRIVRALPLAERFALPRLLDNLLEGLQVLKDWGRLGHAVLWTIISWGLSLMTLYSCSRALGIADSGLLLALAVGLASLSIAIPTTLAGIGLIEGAVQVSGSILGLETIPITALGFLFHGLTVLSYLLMGIPSTWLLGLSLGDLFKKENATLSE